MLLCILRASWLCGLVSAIISSNSPFSSNLSFFSFWYSNYCMLHLLEFSCSFCTFFFHFLNHSFPLYFIWGSFYWYIFKLTGSFFSYQTIYLLSIMLFSSKISIWFFFKYTTLSFSIFNTPAFAYSYLFKLEVVLLFNLSDNSNAWSLHESVFMPLFLIHSILFCLSVTSSILCYFLLIRMN